MPYCSVKWCGKCSRTSSLTKDGITFHRFPKCPKIKEKWIDATKRDGNWFPGKNHVICSRHFTEDCFRFIGGNRRFLFETAVPTLMLPCLTDPAQVQGAGEGEGSPQTKPENVPQQAKPEEVKVPDKPEEQVKQEANVETPKDIQANVADAVPKEEVVQKIEVSSTDAVAIESDNAVSKEEDKPKESTSSDNWEQREQELLKKIEELEKVKNERSEDGLKLELKVREEEIDLLKARVKNLETELQAALSKPGGKNQELIDKIKLQHEELLSKARGMIFDKTKMVKNQELQIEALTTQVQSLKDINQITKDLLEIRNSEVKAMEERFQAMECRFKGEKERYDLVLKRAQTSNNINDDLRKEYETQLAIFKELREKYELRVQALVAENNRLKESMQGGSAPSSTG